MAALFIGLGAFLACNGTASNQDSTVCHGTADNIWHCPEGIGDFEGCPELHADCTYDGPACFSCPYGPPGGGAAYMCMCRAVDAGDDGGDAGRQWSCNGAGFGCLWP